MFSFSYFSPSLFQIQESSDFVGIHCQSPSQKQQYAAAWELGTRLAAEMIKNGAAEILREAKNKTKEDVLAEHARKQELKKLEQVKKAASACPFIHAQHVAEESHKEGGGPSGCPYEGAMGGNCPHPL